jgi:hypothetical protein
VSSRKEQKEALRREREERERAAQAAERRRRLVGYGAAGGLVGAAVIVLAVLLLAGGGDDGSGGSNSLLPSGGEAPEPQITDLDEAARAAGCQLRSFRAKSRDHAEDPDERVRYDSNPPSEGRHFQEPAADGAYAQAPPDSALVHTLEHGRVIVWFKPSLARDARANLKALFDEDDYHIVLVPRRNMDYEVAATAWNAEPEPLGVGRLLGCGRYSEQVFDALRAFTEEHRDNGPELVD